MANNERERKKTYRNWCFQWNRPVVTIYCVMAEPTLFTIWCHFFSAFLLIGACNVFFFCGITFPLNCSPWTCQIREYLCKTNESMIQTSIIGGKQFVVLTFRLSWHSRFWLENISVEVFFHFVSISVWKNFHWMCCLVCIYVDDTIDQLVSGDHTLTDDFRLVCSFCIGDWFVSVTIHISNNTFRMERATKKKHTHTRPDSI